MTAPTERVVLLGASNLTRALSVVLDSVQQLRPQSEVWGALGLGRGYGMRSRVLFRGLPSIVESELWPALARQPALPTTALLTDIGNDLLYGAAPAAIAGWVESCADRLAELRARVIVTGLPLSSLARLTPLRFALFRSLLVPSCRLSLAEAAAGARELEARLVELARGRGIAFVATRPEWYGLDPIHIRPRLWSAAFHEMLGATSAGARAASRRPGRLRLYLLPAQRQWLFGVERRSAQPCAQLAPGCTLRLY